MEFDDFESLKKKPLKLSSGKDKDKKKKSKPKTPDPLAGVSSESKVIICTATKAEKAFKSKQEQISASRIMKKATKSHKQRVEEFNKHLDSLSEHYDIPKVSWTK